MNDSLVSIVVTSYNHAKFLPQRMESLLAQTYPFIEIIVVDDGSTDGSRELLSQYKDNPNITLCFHEINSGYVHASNYGANRANGEYIVFAECDDFSESNQIDELYRAITSNNNIAVAWSCSNMANEEGRISGTDFQIEGPAFQKYCQADVQIPGSLVQKFLMHSSIIPNMSAAMFRKSSFKQVGGLTTKYKLSADLEFWAHMAETGDFYYLKQPLNNFRTHPDTLRNKQGRSVQLIEMIDIISYLEKRVTRTWTEKIALKIHLGNQWAWYAKAEFRSFRKTFFTVLGSTFRHEPLLLFFSLLSLPVLTVKKIGKLITR